MPEKMAFYCFYEHKPTKSYLNEIKTVDTVNIYVYKLVLKLAGWGEIKLKK